MTNKERFIDILNTYCKDRFDVNEFVNYLTTETDFFEAPASTKFHLSERGGLLQHSLHVYDTLSNLCELYYDTCDKSSIAICGLLHDICKTNFYKTEMKNVKTAFGWTSQPAYVIDDKFPVGHGEKSVIMLQRHIDLTNDEILAIRWHMNGFDCAVKGGEMAYSKATQVCKLLTMLETADLISSRILEGE